MAKILFTGKQYLITLSPELVKAMGWKKGHEVLVSKVPEKDLLFIEDIKGKKKTN